MDDALPILASALLPMKMNIGDSIQATTDDYSDTMVEVTIESVGVLTVEAEILALSPMSSSGCHAITINTTFEFDSALTQDCQMEVSALTLPGPTEEGLYAVEDSYTGLPALPYCNTNTSASLPTDAQSGLPTVTHDVSAGTEIWGPLPFYLEQPRAF